MAITITIGRDVTHDSGLVRPMTTAAWQGFQFDLETLVRKHLGGIYFKGLGTGWSEEWGREDAFTIVAPEPLFGDTRKRLYEALRDLARTYEQEAVAVTEGTTEFV
jgi:hypothetical protein